MNWSLHMLSNNTIEDTMKNDWEMIWYDKYNTVFSYFMLMDTKFLMIVPILLITLLALATSCNHRCGHFAREIVNLMEIFQDFYWGIIQRLKMKFINLVCWVKVLLLRLSITVYIYGLVEHQFGLLCWAMTFLVLFLFAKGTNSFHLFLQIPICSYLMFYRHS